MRTLPILLLAALAAPALADDHSLRTAGYPGGWPGGYPGGPGTPLPTAAVAPAQVSGRLSLVNQSGGSVMVSVAGQPAVPLAPMASLQTAAPAGTADVKVTYQQFGRTWTLGTFRPEIRPDRPATVLIPPERTARVQIANRAGRPLTLYVNDRPLLDLRADEVRIISQSAGTAALSLRLGREVNSPVVAAATLDLRPFAEHTLTAEAPKTADLIVQNPFPMPIEVVCDRGIVRTIAPMSSITYAAIPTGTFHLTARRITDEYIDDMQIPVLPWTANTWAADPPDKGLLTLDNNHPGAVRVYVDGRSSASIAPDQERRLNLPIGWHQITVRDDNGRTLQDRWVEVTAFDLGVLAFGRSYPMPVPVQAVPVAGSGCAMPR